MNHFTVSPPRIVFLTRSMIFIDLVAKVWVNSIWKQSLSKARKRGALIPHTVCVRYCNILSPLAQIQKLFVLFIAEWISVFTVCCWCAAYLTSIIAILTVAEDVTAVNLCRKEFRLRCVQSSVIHCQFICTWQPHILGPFYCDQTTVSVQQILFLMELIISGLMSVVHCNRKASRYRRKWTVIVCLKKLWMCKICSYINMMMILHEKEFWLTWEF